MLKIISNLTDKNISKAVKDVLASPRFINAARKEKLEDYKDNFLIQFLKGINKLIKGIFNKLNIRPPKLVDSMSKSGSFYAYIIELLIFVLILGIILFLIIKFLLKREKIKLKQNDNAQKIDINADYYTLAQEASSKSELKSAIRFMFLGILVSLSKLNLLKIAEGKTNYQYYLELRKNKSDGLGDKSFISKFRNCIFIFNEIWYGKKQADLLKYDTCKSFYEEITAVGRQK
jgi:competence protein ComGC